MKSEKTKTIFYNGETIHLTLGGDGLYRSKDGTVYALRDENSSVNGDDDRCGVGCFSLAESNKYTPACKAHDYTYSSPAFQRDYTRLEADLMFKSKLKILGASSLVAKAMYKVVRIFGGFFWEGRK